MRLLVCCSALLASVSMAAESGARVSEDFEQVLPLSLGGSLSVENSNGSITVETWNEASVRIEARKRARSNEALEDIEIRVTGSGDRVDVETIHHRRNDRGSVEYQVYVPVESNVRVETANGTVRVEGVHGRVDAYSTNGGLRIEEISGVIDARTTNGTIRARYDRADDGDHRFETTNGSVRIYLPDDAGGSLDAETVNGSIEIDFPVQLERSSRRRIQGSFGDGAGSWTIETVNGSVKLLRD